MNTLLENIRASAILMKNLPSTLSGDALLISREEARRIGYELEACAERMEHTSAASPKVPQGVGEAACSPTKGMNLGERIAHAGGRENEAGYIEFGSVMAVDALINHVLRHVLTIPEGMAIVPVKPTCEMINAALPSAMRESDEDKYRAMGMIICIWDEMLAATKEKGE